MVSRKDFIALSKVVLFDGKHCSYCVGYESMDNVHFSWFLLFVAELGDDIETVEALNTW